MTPDTVRQLLEVAVQLAVPAGLITLGFWTGRRIERRHYESIHAREAQFVRLPAVPTKRWDTEREVAETRMVTGSVVVAVDYFKQFAGSLRNFFGGRMRAHESLLDRARREAVLRMKESFPDADIIVNLRLETSTISKQTSNLGSLCVELVAYGTAIKYRS